MPHNQTGRIVFGADGKPNNSARRMFNIAPGDIAHLAAAGLQAGESAPVWHRVGSGNPLTSGGSGGNEAGVDFGWAPLTFAGVACALTADSNTLVLGLPGTYSIGDPELDPTFAGDVNIEHQKLDFEYSDFAVQFKAAMATAAASGDGVLGSATYDPNSGNLSLTTTLGATVTVNVPGVADTLTAFALVGGTTLRYTDEAGNDTDVDLATVIAGAETTTALSLAGNTLTYTDEDGVATPIDLSGYVNVPETVTSLTLNANVLTYTDEDGAANNLDLSLYLDDTNLARLVSGTLNATTGIATFARDDATTFDLDLSALLDDTNLARVVSGAFNAAGDTLTLTRDDSSSFDIAVPSGLTETVTTLAMNAGALDYTDEAGVVNNIPLVSAEAGNLLVPGDDGALYAMPLVSETCYRELVDAPEPGTEFTLDNTTGGPSNAGVTFGTSQIFHAPDRQIFFDTNVLPFGARIKSVSMFEERRGNNTAPVRTQYGGVNSSAINVAAHGNGYSATRSTSTFATSQLVDAATPLILLDPSQNHWDYAAGADADFIASITAGTATASGGANDGVTSSLTGFNALVEFELSQINEYTVREYSDGETTKLVYFDAAGDPVELASIPAGWEVCPADNAPLVSTEEGNTLLLGDDGALYSMPLVGETCYTEPGTTYEFATNAPVSLSNGDMLQASGASNPSSAPLRISAGFVDMQVDEVRVRAGANGFNPTGTMDLGGVTYVRDTAVNPDEDINGIYRTLVFVPQTAPLVLAAGTSVTSQGNWGSMTGGFQGPVISPAGVAPPFGSGNQARALVTFTEGTLEPGAQHTVQEYSDGETTKLIEFVAGEPVELAEIPATWTLCPEVDTAVLEDRVEALEDGLLCCPRDFDFTAGATANTAGEPGSGESVGQFTMCERGEITITHSATGFTGAAGAGVGISTTPLGDTSSPIAGADAFSSSADRINAGTPTKTYTATLDPGTYYVGVFSGGTSSAASHAVTLENVPTAVDLCGVDARVTDLEASPLVNLSAADLPEFADNAAATGGGLAVDDMYKTATGEIRCVV